MHALRHTDTNGRGSVTHTKDALTGLLERGIVWQAAAPSSPSPFTFQRRESPVIPFGIQEIDETLPAGGLPCGALHELSYEAPRGSYNDRTSREATLPHVLPLHLAEQTLRTDTSSSQRSWQDSSPTSCPFFIIWIGRACWPSPLVLSHSLRKASLFLHPRSAEATLWAIETTLQSPLTKLVIADCPAVSLTTTRRFALAAREHTTTALLLHRAHDAQLSSAAMTQWSISPFLHTPEMVAGRHSALMQRELLPRWQLTLRKIKGSGLTKRSWIIGVEDRYDTGEEVSMRLFSRMGDGCYEEEGTCNSTEKSAAPRFGT
jgi:hypothetical protein